MTTTLNLKTTNDMNKLPKCAFKLLMICQLCHRRKKGVLIKRTDDEINAQIVSGKHELFSKPARKLTKRRRP